jgi:plastocyanin
MLLKNLFGCVLLVVALNATAAEYQVGQKDKQFSESHLKIKVGDTVNFLNFDPFFHNVFSLSDVKTFDLGSYPQGQGRQVTFNSPGMVEVECAIHSQMKLVIEVTK